MIITRTGEAVEFRLDDARRVAIDMSHVASASHVVERNAAGRLVNALVLITDHDNAPYRVEASAAEIMAMHARLAEVMGDSSGPALSRETWPDKPEPTLN